MGENKYIYVYNEFGAYSHYTWSDVCSIEDLKESDPNKYYSYERYDYVKYENNELLPLTKDEIESKKFLLYKLNKYTPNEYEIILSETERIITVDLRSYEYIEDNKILVHIGKKRHLIQSQIRSEYYHKRSERYITVGTIKIKSFKYIENLMFNVNMCEGHTFLWHVEHNGFPYVFELEKSHIHKLCKMEYEYDQNLLKETRSKMSEIDNMGDEDIINYPLTHCE